MTDGGVAETETGTTAIIITNETIETSVVNAENVTSVVNANTKAGAAVLMSAGKSAAVL